MKTSSASSALAVLSDCVKSLLDIFSIGITSFEEDTPEADARNLRYDLEQISGDFRRVISEIESGGFNE